MADEHVYGFSKTDAMQLLQRLGIGAEVSLGNGGHSGAYIVKSPSGGIAGRSGTTVTFGDCDVYSIIGTTLTAAGFTVRATNLSTTAVASAVYGVILFAGGVQICVWEDC